MKSTNPNKDLYIDENKYLYVGLVYFKHKDIKRILFNRTYPMQHFFAETSAQAVQMKKQRDDDLKKTFYIFYSQVFKIQNITKEEVLDKIILYDSAILKITDYKKGVHLLPKWNDNPIWWMWEVSQFITDRFCEEILPQPEPPKKEKPWRHKIKGL